MIKIKISRILFMSFFLFLFHFLMAKANNNNGQILNINFI
jgi:hypothetical protein